LAATLAAAIFALPLASNAQDSEPPGRGPAESCVDVRIGDELSYACLNQELEKLAPMKRYSAEQDSPYSAGSPAPVVGTFNQAATRERLGNNFGKSVVPQRPPAPVYTPQLMPVR
jgi:hypothetical protein